MQRKKRLITKCPILRCRNVKKILIVSLATRNDKSKGKFFIYDNGFIGYKNWGIREMIFNWTFWYVENWYKYPSYQGIINSI